MTVERNITPHLPYLRRHAAMLLLDRTRGDHWIKKFLSDLVGARPQALRRIKGRQDLFRYFHDFLPKSALDVGSADDPVLARILHTPPNTRAAFLLVAAENYSPEDAAYILRTTPGSIEKKAHAAQLALESSVKTSVMIMEDEPIIAADLISIVSALGHSVSSVAPTLAEAVEKARDPALGLILADIQLADGSSGKEAVLTIKRERNIPVIFITAFPERLLTGDRPEPTFLITKPFHPETVKAAITQALFFEPSKLSEREVAAKAKESRLEDLIAVSQNPLGLQIENDEEKFDIARRESDSDTEIAKQRLTSSMQAHLQRLAENAVPLARRVDNQPGWAGLYSALRSLSDIFSIDPELISSHLGDLYSLVLEVGSYLDQDDRISLKSDGFVDPLPPELRRSLANLRQLGAPWLRKFPTIVELDDQAGRLLVPPMPEAISKEITSELARLSLISSELSQAIYALLAAAERGEYLGSKAQGRGTATVKNILTQSMAILAAFYVGGVSSNVAPVSPIIKTSSDFYLSHEKNILEAFSQAPGYLQEALSDLLETIKSNPPSAPQDKDH